jgi:predicted metal-dependent hydrolase
MEDGIFERFAEGIKKFNSGSFYECHDILEDVWFDVRGPSRRFYQGLIHLAVGFYHIVERENPKGALSQLSKGVDKLNDFIPGFQGIELSALLNKINKCIELIKKGGVTGFDKKFIPKIKFDASLFREP